MQWIHSEEGKDHKWSEYLLAAPDLFHLLCKLSIDKDVPVKEKAMLAGAIAYFVSPIDLVPEAIVGPIGYVDDISLAAYVLNQIVNNTDPEVLKRHWAGDGDLLDLIQHILERADKMVGSGLWNKLRNMIK
ncbi:MAG: DUF1232 domain-containing protein [Deltaproteobacteria bacterium]|nr:DUF1232 domain-containing protein [Deltaproteobacteria bacterium]NNK86380.1 DUF1232 domain-containing protein [Desulfobacterales bacterium]